MITEQIAHPAIVSAAEWREERLRLLDHEKELTKQHDRVNAERRRLPMVKLEKEYVFEGADGTKNLLDLFEGGRQLIVYHFMFEPDADKGCPGCTGFVDAIGSLSSLKKLDTTFILISRAPYAKFKALKEQKGWSMPWYSSFGSDFNYDFHVTTDGTEAHSEYNYRPTSSKGENPGLSVFFRLNGTAYHTYSAFARGVEMLTDTYALLDTTPFGRQEDFEDSPPGWPQKPTYG